MKCVVGGSVVGVDAISHTIPPYPPPSTLVGTCARRVYLPFFETARGRKHVSTLDTEYAARAHSRTSYRHAVDIIGAVNSSALVLFKKTYDYSASVFADRGTINHKQN